MKKVSFDFDGTLTRLKVQKYAKMLIEKGFEVWIVTSRFGFGQEPKPDWNDDLFKVADEIGITRDHIHFCCMDNKANFLNGKGFVWHLDDDLIELSFIRTDSDCAPISCFGDKTYLQKCSFLINIHNDESEN